MCPRLRKDAEVEHGSGSSSNGHQEIPFHEAVTLNPGLPWRAQDVKDIRIIGYMLRIAANRECQQPKRKKCVAVNRAE